MAAPDAHRTFDLLRQAKSAALTDEQAAALRLAETDTEGRQARILVVDDSDALRDLMVYTLRDLGYHKVTEAANGLIALACMKKQAFDLVVLDIEMPLMNGFDVLKEVKLDQVLARVPIIVASGVHDLESVVRCIELGAEDFLPKPVNAVLLRARLSATLERTRLRERERLHLIELRCEKELLVEEREKSERLLLNILPAAIAERLKFGERTIADRHTHVTVLFADLVGFTGLVSSISPEELVDLLSDLFSRFDRLANRHRVEKIKTIGDCYLVVGGLPGGEANHEEAVAKMALEMLTEISALNHDRGLSLSLRIGLNSGPVVAGVIGHNKFAYDLWGVTVNLASRMQSSGLPDRIHLPTKMAETLQGKFRFSQAGPVDCKGIGVVESCFLEGRAE